MFVSLQAIRLQNGTRDTIAKTNYSLNENGLFSGQVMIPGGMSEDGKGLYYQVVTLDNENINYQGDTTLKYYSCANNVSTEIKEGYHIESAKEDFYDTFYPEINTKI